MKTNLKLHVIAKHPEEKLVKQYLSTKKEETKKLLMEHLRIEGNHQHNVEVLYLLL